MRPHQCGFDAQSILRWWEGQSRQFSSPTIGARGVRAGNAGVSGTIVRMQRRRHDRCLQRYQLL